MGQPSEILLKLFSSKMRDWSKNNLGGEEK